MIQVIQRAERRSLNVIRLTDLLSRSGARFRKTVLRSLAQEGFEFDGPLPSLQHPSEVLEALGRSVALDASPAGEALSAALLAAGRKGILLDLRPRPDPFESGFPPKHANTRAQ